MAMGICQEEGDGYQDISLGGQEPPDDDDLFPNVRLKDYSAIFAMVQAFIRLILAVFAHIILGLQMAVLRATTIITTRTVAEQTAESMPILRMEAAGLFSHSENVSEGNKTVKVCFLKKNVGHDVSATGDSSKNVTHVKQERSLSHPQKISEDSPCSEALIGNPRKQERDMSDKGSQNRAKMDNQAHTVSGENSRSRASLSQAQPFNRLLMIIKDPLIPSALAGKTHVEDLPVTGEQFRDRARFSQKRHSDQAHTISDNRSRPQIISKETREENVCVCGDDSRKGQQTNLVKYKQEIAEKCLHPEERTSNPREQSLNVPVEDISLVDSAMPVSHAQKITEDCSSLKTQTSKTQSSNPSTGSRNVIPLDDGQLSFVANSNSGQNEVPRTSTSTQFSEPGQCPHLARAPVLNTVNCIIPPQDIDEQIKRSRSLWEVANVNDEMKSVNLLIDDHKIITIPNRRSWYL